MRGQQYIRLSQKDALDEDDLTHALIWPEIQQELKIIESEEELSSLPQSTQKTSPITEAGPAPSPSPEASGSPPCSSTPLEVWTSDPANQSTPEAAILANREKLEPVCSLPGSESEQGFSPDPASLAPLQILLFEKVSSPARIEMGGPRNLSPPLPPAPPPPTPLEEEPRVLLSKEGPEREDASMDSRTDPYTEQPKPKDNPGTPSLCQREEAIASPNEKQNAKHAVPESKVSGLPSPTKEVEVAPQEEGDAPHAAQEPSDCDEDDTVTDTAQHGLEMVEPWEEPQWVTSPLHSPTLKEVQQSQMQCPQGHRLERRLCHRPSLRQSHSLDSKTTGKSHWTLEVPFSSSCANLETERNYEPLQPPAARNKTAGWEEKALKTFREFSGLKGLEILPSQKGSSGIPSKPVETSFISLAEGKHQGPQQGLNNPQMKHNDVPGPESSMESSPRDQDSTSPGEHPVKSQLKSTECGPSKGKHRPSSLNLDSASPITDLFRLENGASFSSPGIELSELGDAKVTWMTSSHCKAAPWNSQDTQDLDIVAHALTGRRNSAPVSVSAVRTSFMVKMCQAKAVPVIPPKIQYTQIPQPLPSQSTGEGGAQPLERNQEEPGSTTETPQKPTKDDSPSSLESPKEEQPKQEAGAFASQRKGSTASCMCEGSFCSPEPGVSNVLSTQDAMVQCRKRTSETEPSADNIPFIYEITFRRMGMWVSP
ncbi:hypothetical protein A6R68_13911 [Neotoma lepida]|uniref:Uncharacterized protein n=1 Tax=Neotoma lepida TaxID=56216 RepID=A0A1A6H1L8_NEOLE|nr:hypothetical protein A6R68_13911 [Neotoma lepida]